MVLIDGRTAAAIDVTDRGLWYGDGLFETLLVRNGAPCLWRAHVDRLFAGARRLGIPAPAETLLRSEARQLVGDQANCVLKILLTRGRGGRGYRPPERSHPTRILIRLSEPGARPAAFSDGIDVILCRHALGINPSLAGVKHLNRLEQILARAEWSDPTIGEGLMCDSQGRVVCGTMTNLFVVNGRMLATPRLDRCGITGTVRAQAMKLAEETGYTLAECDLLPSDLMRADGLFLTNSLAGVLPVVTLGEHRFELDRLPWKLLDGILSRAHTPEPDF